VREALLMLAATLPDTNRMFGPKDQVDPVRHLIGTATGWGGNPEKDAMYLTVVPSKNDGTTVYKLTAKDVPVDGFWSISVYNAKGYFEKNQYDAYTLNNITAIVVTLGLPIANSGRSRWLPLGSVSQRGGSLVVRSGWSSRFMQNRRGTFPDSPIRKTRVASPRKLRT
jgi:hypothetical protein